MLNKSNVGEVVPGAVEGARSVTGSAPGAGAEVKRWSANRKKEVVLRLLRGEPVDAISREVSVPIYRNGASVPWPVWMRASRSARTIRWRPDLARPPGALASWSWRLRSRKERQARHPLGNRRSSK
jgi:hypothetical protein